MGGRYPKAGEMMCSRIGAQRHPAAQGEQGGHSLMAEVRQQQHESGKREEREQVRLDVLALREVVQCTVPLGPGDRGDEDSDEKQQDAAQQQKLRR